jgi:hypothetical protein
VVILLLKDILVVGIILQVIKQVVEVAAVLVKQEVMPM